MRPITRQYVDKLSVKVSKIKYSEFDYLALQEALKEYKYPKDKITKLLRDKYIIKLKRGFYIKNDESNSYISKEIIANLLYGPSYISLEYALSFYNMIPERVSSVTSITTKKRKEYRTGAGTFLYYKISRNYFPLGVLWKRQSDSRGYFIASPEKALIDKLYFDEAVQSQKEMLTYLFENLRIEKHSLKGLDIILIENILHQYKKKSLLNLPKVLKKL